MVNQRSSGILLHITALPSQYGIGDLGPEAYRFADFLKAAGQRHWQILPINPIEEGGHSPYTSPSAFAGNQWLISPDLLVKAGYLKKEELKPIPAFPKEKTAFKKVFAYKEKLFQKAFERFQHKITPATKKQLKKFEKTHSLWLQDFCLFQAVKKHLNENDWSKWPDELRDRDQQALKEWKKKLKEEIDKEKFLQYVFYQQWEQLKSYSNKKGIEIFGDLAFYVCYNSADVWTNPQNFKLNKKGKPSVVSGVPPDYFSETGQLWGTPVYDWNVLKKDKYRWWFHRVAHNLKLFDLLRLDHFRAFAAYWEVPASHDTAMNGKWIKTPGVDFFRLLKKELPKLPIVAEDLGYIDQPVHDLMAQFDLPGMKLLLFAFGDDMPQGAYIPHNHVQNCIVYTGTHDNNTVKGWFEHEASAADKKRLAAYANQQVNRNNVHKVMVHLSMMSVANRAILPMQDILGLGRQAVFNRPSTSKGNWQWRLHPKYLTEKLQQELLAMVRTYGRI